MNGDSFLNYRGFRFLWFNLITLVVLLGFYILDRPIGGRSGGSWLGYIYGGLATLGILILMWYGIRKRSYRARRTTLKGCLAFHVWLGVALLIVVPLHCAFSFGLNVHTLAYALMVVVILSGIWGAINFIALAPEVQSHRGGGTVGELAESIEKISQEISQLSKGADQNFSRFLTELNISWLPTLKSAVFGKEPPNLDLNRAASILAKMPEGTKIGAEKIIVLVSKRRELLLLIQDEAQKKFWLRAWLWVHLPISCALLAVVFIHIFSVFYYR